MPNCSDIVVNNCSDLASTLDRLSKYMLNAAGPFTVMMNINDKAVDSVALSFTCAV